MGKTRFTIEDVARINNIEILKYGNGEFSAVCPFCGNRKGKFSCVIQKGNKKNIYNCFACGSHGSGLKLHMQVSANDYSGGNDYKKAICDIMNSINSNNYACKSRAPFYKKPVEEAEKASSEKISKVYYHMISLLELSEKHKADLLRRGLTQADIERFRFRSMPEDVRKLCKSMYLWCKQNELSLEGVPGFYRDKKGYWSLRRPGAGYFCPVYAENLITGFQIRMDNPIDGAKYLWLSSVNMQNGVSSGSPSTYLKGKHEECVIIVEGILKATIVYCLLNGAISVIGVPGIKVISGIYPFLKSLNNSAYVVEAYDMDKQYQRSCLPLLSEANALIERGEISRYMDLCTTGNEEHFHDLIKVARISAAADKLRKSVEEYGLSVHPLTWDTEGSLWKGNYKGLDDFLQSYSKRDTFTNYLLDKASRNLKMKAFFHLV